MGLRGKMSGALAIMVSSALLVTLAPVASAQSPTSASSTRTVSGSVKAPSSLTEWADSIDFGAQKPAADFSTSGDKGDAVAASASPSPSAPKAPTISWKSEGKTDYVRFNSGFLRYARTPAATIVPGMGFVGHEQRGFSGLPSIPSQNKGSDFCKGSSEGQFIKAPTQIYDSECGNTLNRGDQMCHLSPHGTPYGREKEELWNYSYGTDWTVFVRYQIWRKYVDGVATGETRRERLDKEYAVKWGNCSNYVYQAPFEDPFDCPIEHRGDLTVRGPYGKGLPTVNHFTGSTIPASVEKTKPYEVPGKSPIGRAWNGGNLYGLGQNQQSIALVERCRDWAVEFPEASPNYYGNWDFTTRIQMAKCTIVRYPGYGQSNFIGCKETGIETNSYTKHVYCRSGRPQAAPIIANGQNMNRSFTPEAMECFDVTCDWTYPGSRQASGNGRGWPLVTQDKSRGITVDVRDRTFKTYADGEAWRFRYPELRMATLATEGANATRINNRWTFFEVKRNSSPWNPRHPTSPNHSKQWFYTEAENTEGALSVNLGIGPGSGYCIPRLDSCVERGDVASVAGADGGKPIYTQGPAGRPNFAYNFNINFYEASRQGQQFSVRGLYQQQYRGDYALPSNVTIMVQDVYLGGRQTITYTTISTCSTGWTNMSVVSQRVQP